MEVLSDAEVQDILNVTALSIAKHCGLVDDPDDRSEQRRTTDLSRQLGLLQTWSLSEAEAVYSEFSAKYLPALVTLYKTYTTPENMATTTINAVCHLPYFVRYQKTPAASDLAVLQATRIANATNDPSEPKVVGEICQFLSTLLVLQGTTAIPEDVKEKLIPKLDTWRHRFSGQFPGETSDRCYQSLKGTLEMTVMSRMMKEALETPLNQCGLGGCGHRVDSLGPELKQCSSAERHIKGNIGQHTKGRAIPRPSDLK